MSLKQANDNYISSELKLINMLIKGADAKTIESFVSNLKEPLRWHIKDTQTGAPLFFHAIRHKNHKLVDMCIGQALKDSKQKHRKDDCSDIGENSICQMKDLLYGNTALHEAIIHLSTDTELFTNLLLLGCCEKTQNVKGVSAERLIERLSYHHLAAQLSKNQARRRAFNFLRKIDSIGHTKCSELAPSNRRHLG